VRERNRIVKRAKDDEHARTITARQARQDAEDGNDYKNGSRLPFC
jgi:hypothetical protein